MPLYLPSREHGFAYESSTGTLFPSASDTIAILRYSPRISCSTKSLNNVGKGVDAMSSSAPTVSALTTPGIRKNGKDFRHIYYYQRSIVSLFGTGKQWHVQKSAFRPTSGQTSYEKRTAERKAMNAMKAKEKEMKDEKEGERQVRRDFR